MMFCRCHLFTRIVLLSATLAAAQVALSSGNQGKHSNATAQQAANELEWWKKTNFYHIYLRSFQDSNGDGNGDLRGVVQRLDYLQRIGVGTILMAPFYVTPMKDGGYDISDFTDVDPFFGELADFDELIKALHARGMRMVVDFVPNHSSNVHPWFSCSERAYLEPERCGRYKDYYVWSNSTRYRGEYPSNWISVFGGVPAWTYSELRKEFYLHQFLPEQPDLNFRNPDVREEFKEIARFWLRRGADGLRVDSAIYLIEDEQLRDEPPNPNWRQGDDPSLKLDHIHTRSLYESAMIVKDWQDVINEPEFGGSERKVIITEAYAAIPKLIEYYGPDPKTPFANMPFNFELLLGVTSSNWSPAHVKTVIMSFLKPTRDLGWPDEGGAVSPWIIWVTGNHDNPRVPDRVGDSHKMLFKWLAYLAPGVPVNYYGDELGMADIPRDRIPQRTIDEGEPSRLGERSPIAWDASEPSGGFSSSASLWLPLESDYASQNVESLLERDDNNYLQQFLTLQRVRDQHLDVFLFGDLVFFECAPFRSRPTSPIFAMARTHEQFGNIMLLANLDFEPTGGGRPLPPPPIRLQAAKSTLRHVKLEPPETGTILLSNVVGATGDSSLAVGREVDLRYLLLKPAQAILIKY